MSATPWRAKTITEHTAFILDADGEVVGCFSVETAELIVSAVNAFEGAKAAKKARPQDPIWNTLCEIYGYPNHRPPQSKCARWGKLVRDLKAIEPAPEAAEMIEAHRAMVDSWDGKEVSPEKFVDWFPRFRSRKVEQAAAPRLEEMNAESRRAEIDRQAKELFG